MRTAHTADLDDEDSSLEPSLLGLLATDPRVWTVVASVVLGLVAARDLLGSGVINGGALPPAPGSVGHWWSAWWSGHHDLGSGSAAPAPGYLLLLAVLGTLFVGQPGWVVAVIFVLGVPLAFIGAVRFFRRLLPDAWLPVGAAAVYAVLPVVSGALAQGRIGTVVTAVVLPWLATAALGLRRAERDPRWRAVWRTTLGVGIVVAFSPSAWLVVLLLVVVLLAQGLVTDRARWRQPSWWLGPVVVLVGPALLTLPWFLGALASPGALLVEAGRPDPFPGAGPAAGSTFSTLLGQLGGPGTGPAWVGAALVVVGLLALLRPDTRPRVAVAWLVVAASAVTVLVLAWVRVRLPGVADPFHPYAGTPVLLVQAGLVTAAAVAAQDLRGQLAGRVGQRGLPWRPVVSLLGVAAGAVALVGGLGWWLAGGAADPVHRGVTAGVPAYMTDLGSTDLADGVLVLRGDLTSGVRYEVLRDGPLTLGDDGIAALTPPDDRLTGVVQRLLADPRPADSSRLASYGVAYVYAPAPVSPRVAGAFDAGAGFSRASAGSPDDASWRLQTPTSLRAAQDAGQPLHLLWVLLQALATIAVVVLAAPTRRVVG